jgi:integrase
VKPGLCFHGLRHSLGTTLYDLGLDREARKAALGHTSDAASMVYERGGNRRAASDRAFAAFDVHLATYTDKIKNAK